MGHQLVPHYPAHSTQMCETTGRQGCEDWHGGRNMLPILSALMLKGHLCISSLIYNKKYSTQLRIFDMFCHKSLFYWFHITCIVLFNKVFITFFIIISSYWVIGTFVQMQFCRIFALDCMII